MNLRPLRYRAPSAVIQDDEDMAAIEERLARIKVTGERLPPAILKLTYR